MSLHDDYPDDFIELWNLYPKIPTGRSKKRPSYLAFRSAKNALRFTPDDIAFIARNIQERLIQCETWQPGNKYGAPMFATYMNQRLWTEPYESKSRKTAHSALYGEFEQTPPKGPPTPEERRRAREALMATGLLTRH
jgi:hypothetical protein